MAIRLRFQGGARAGEVEEFADGKSRIVLGRNADACDVVFPQDETRVGREHCALERVLGRYRLILNKENLVLVDGEEAVDGQELAREAELQLGEGGPTLIAETLLAEGHGGETVGRRPEGPGRATIAASVQRHRSGILAVVALVLVVVIVAWIQMRREQHERTRIEKQTTEVVERVGEMEREVATARGELTGLAAELQKVGPHEAAQLREALARAAASVYLVVIRDDASGRVRPAATAWVVGDGVLATNAHVAEEFGSLAEGSSLVVRASSAHDAEERDHRVERVELHPGYGAFETLMAAYNPQEHFAGRDPQKLRFPGACDVALMWVEEASGLARPLPVAGDAELLGLTPGEPIGLVGFPMENLRVLNANDPTPQTQLAHVTAATDFFFEADAAGREAQLIHHSLPTVGGASGSPILNARGNVVAVHHAGNYVFLPGQGRIPSAALINFGQRADLVRELLEGTAAARQEERAERWRASVAQFPTGAIDVEERFLALVSSFREDVGASHLTEVVSSSGAMEDEAERWYQSVVEHDVAQGGVYHFAAVAPGGQDIDLIVGVGEQELGRDFEMDPWPHVAVPIAGPERVTVTVVGYEERLPYELRVHRADVDPTARRLAAVVTEWRTPREAGEPRLVHDGPVTIASAGEWQPVPDFGEPEAGDYLFVAVSRDGSDIDLRLVGAAGEVVEEDTWDDNWPVLRPELDGRAVPRVEIRGATAGAECRFQVHALLGDRVTRRILTVTGAFAAENSWTEVERLTEGEGTLSAAGAWTSSARVSADRPGVYQALAVAEAGENVDLRVTDAVGTVLGEDVADDDWPVVALHLSEPAELDVQVRGPAGASWRLVVTVAAGDETDRLLAGAVAQWRAALSSDATRRLVASSGVLETAETWHPVHELADAPTGRYFVIAVAPGGEDVNLRVVGADGSVLGSDTLDDHWPYVRFALDQPTTVSVEIWGAVSGSAYRLEAHVEGPGAAATGT